MVIRAATVVQPPWRTHLQVPHKEPPPAVRAQPAAHSWCCLLLGSWVHLLLCSWLQGGHCCCCGSCCLGQHTQQGPSCAVEVALPRRLLDLLLRCSR
jgi:hypothetical protein